MQQRTAWNSSLPEWELDTQPARAVSPWATPAPAMQQASVAAPAAPAMPRAHQYLPDPAAAPPPPTPVFTEPMYQEVPRMAPPTAAPVPVAPVPAPAAASTPAPAAEPVAAPGAPELAWLALRGCAVMAALMAAASSFVLGEFVLPIVLPFALTSLALTSAVVLADRDRFLSR